MSFAVTAKDRDNKECLLQQGFNSREQALRFIEKIEKELNLRMKIKEVTR